jgi:hypothetical protein
MAANFSASAEILALILENLAVVSGFTVYTGVGLQCTVHCAKLFAREGSKASRIMIFFGGRGGGFTLKLAGRSASYGGQLQRQRRNSRPYTREPRRGEWVYSVHRRGLTVYAGVGLQCTPEWVYSVHRSGIVYTGVGLQCTPEWVYSVQWSAFTVYAGPNYSPGEALRHLELLYFLGFYIETSQKIDLSAARFFPRWQNFSSDRTLNFFGIVGNFRLHNRTAVTVPIVSTCDAFLS